MGPRTTSAVMMFMAAVFLGIGVYTPVWFEREDNGWTTRVGLRETTVCFRGECEASDNEPAPRRPITQREQVAAWTGRISYGVGLATALASLICAMILAVRRTRHGAIVVLGLSLVSAASAGIFIRAMPYPLSMLEWSARGFLGGSAIAFLGALLAIAKVPLVPYETQFARRRR